MLEMFLIVVFESLSCSLISKSYSHCWKGFKYAKDAGKLRIRRTWRIFLKKIAQFNCSEQTITKQKNSRGSSGNHTVLRTKGSQTFEGAYLNNFSNFLSCGLNVSIFYVKYLI